MKWVSLLCMRILTKRFLNIHVSRFDLTVGGFLRIGVSQRLTALQIDGPEFVVNHYHNHTSTSSFPV
jgi:hypothetical protein